MTKDTESAIKKRIFTAAKEKAANCLSAMGAKPGVHKPNTWEGVMAMLSDVLRRGDEDEKSAAIMTAAKWTHYHEECETMRELEEMDEAIDAEIKALVEASQEEEEAGEEAEHADHAKSGK